MAYGAKKEPSRLEREIGQAVKDLSREFGRTVFINPKGRAEVDTPQGRMLSGDIARIELTCLKAVTGVRPETKDILIESEDPNARGSVGVYYMTTARRQSVNLEAFEKERYYAQSVDDALREVIEEILPTP